MGVYRRLAATLRWVRQYVWLLQVTARAYHRQVACAMVVALVALAATMPSLDSSRPGSRQGQQAALSGGPWQAGRWQVTVAGACERHLANIGTCDSVLGAGIVRAKVSMQVVSDAQGGFTFHAQRLYVGIGTGISPQCNAGFEDAVSVTGVCRETARGRGTVADLGTGPRFYISEEWVTFYGRSVVRAVPVSNPGRYLADAPVQAVLGTHTLRQIATLLGVSGPLPPGLQLAVAVRPL